MTAYVKNASVPPHLVDSRDPPAIALLKEDHQIFRALFDLIETIGEDVLFPIAGETFQLRERFASAWSST